MEFSALTSALAGRLESLELLFDDLRRPAPGNTPLRFGIITPVFDGCLASLELLFGDLRRQTYGNWVWILCSNGYSERMDRFAAEKNGILANGRRDAPGGPKPAPRIIYYPIPFEATDGSRALLANIGKRRDMCIRAVDCDYVFMIDADAKLLDDRMFRYLDLRLKRSPKDLCVYRIIHDLGILPRFPIGHRRIDMLNFCVSARLARKIGFPRTVNREKASNDYWYFMRAYAETKGDILFIRRIFGKYNGNNRYTNMLDLMRSQP